MMVDISQRTTSYYRFETAHIWDTVSNIKMCKIGYKCIILHNIVSIIDRKMTFIIISESFYKNIGIKKKGLSRFIFRFSF